MIRRSRGLAFPPQWTEATPADIEVVARQLGRRPVGVLKVAKRCRFGRPQVIVNAPVRFDRTGNAQPFPTLFWLTCPYLVKAVGALEGEGWIDRLRAELERSEKLAAAMARAHEAHARLRMALLDEQAAGVLSSDEREVLETSGVGGSRRRTGVKCLHAHLADYLGRQGGEDVNPIGREIAGLLLERGVDLDGWRDCAACSGCAKGAGGPVAAIDAGSNAVRMLIARTVRGEPGETGGSSGTGETIGTREAGEPGKANNPRQTRDSGESRDSGEMKHPGEANEPGEARRRARLEILDFGRAATRLADALSPGGRGSGETLAAIERFAERARALGASVIMGVATAAVRDSECARPFLLDVWERCGFSLRVISGREEAQLAFLGAIRSLGDWWGEEAREPVTVVDVGGGSTEVVGGDLSGAVRWSASVPVGAVRLTREFAPVWNVGAAPFAGEEDAEAGPFAPGKGPRDDRRAAPGDGRNEEQRVTSVDGRNKEQRVTSIDGRNEEPRVTPGDERNKKPREESGEGRGNNPRETSGDGCDEGPREARDDGRDESPAEGMYRAALTRLRDAGVPPPGEKPGRLIAVGGAATSLAAMALKLDAFDPRAVRGARIKKSEIERLLDRLSSMPLAERLGVPGLEPDRADIIPAGLAILKALTDLLDADEVTVSDGGVMHGLIWSWAGG